MGKDNDNSDVYAERVQEMHGFDPKKDGPLSEQKDKLGNRMYFGRVGKDGVLNYFKTMDEIMDGDLGPSEWYRNGTELVPDEDIPYEQKVPVLSKQLNLANAISGASGLNGDLEGNLKERPVYDWLARTDPTELIKKRNNDNGDKE